ncbi:recombinase family protein [Rhodococcoides fascians]|uniref:recombinase family protein n=1 Tax=Rhodococcoides fascians TaxID=1828 RepID=UPI00278828B3|nr:recombinase family protein [Rhodococcus fascians]MDQ0283802.1 DNA invertase Pin-like site-specific DNA recombinase [Rhodococcus fascians]
MRAILYTRVSSDPSGRGRSVGEQEAECREVCAREGWDVAEVLTDNDTGASRWSGKNRPAYRDLERALQPGDVLVTWEASRAQRDLKAYVQLRDLCAERGVLWSYSGRTYDLTRGDDRFTTGLDALLSEKEAEQTRERVLRGVRANAAAGKPHGKLPYGYRILRDPETGESMTRVPDEVTAPHVREIVRRLLEGEALYAICKDFDARGIPGPRPDREGNAVKWNPITMRKIAESPTYAALRVHKGAVTGPATWEPLISQDDHDAILALLSDPSRSSTTGRKPAWLLTGIALCGVCGGKVNRAKNRGYDTYVCREGFCVTRRTTHVDKLVGEAVVRRLEKPDILELLNTTSTEGADALAESRSLRQRLDSFTDQAADGALSAAALARVEAKLLPQIAAAERRARSLVLPPIVAAFAGPDARVKWDAADWEPKRALVRAVVKVELLRKTTTSRHFDPESVRLTFI